MTFARVAMYGRRRAERAIICQLAIASERKARVSAQTQWTNSLGSGERSFPGNTGAEYP